MMNVPWMSWRQLVLSTAFNGVFTFSPRATARANTGVSSSLTRTYTPRATITAEARNGMRQPQVRKVPSCCGSVLSWPIQMVSSRKKPLAKRNPIGAPSWGHMAARARLPFSAVSVASSAAPLHSPPRPRPWQNRMMASIAGAHRPIWW